jgi:hypothetical protein
MDLNYNNNQHANKRKRGWNYLEALELALHGLHLHLEFHNSNTSREYYQKQKKRSEKVGSILLEMVTRRFIPQIFRQKEI